MKRDDILMLEGQMDILEKEARILEDFYNKKNPKEFEKSKSKILSVYKKIKETIK